jgi:hypothetical protein
MADDLTLFRATAKLAAMIGHEARSLFLRVEAERGLAILATRFLPRLGSMASMIGGLDAEIFSADLAEVYLLYAAAVCGPDWAKRGEPPFVNDEGATYESHVVYVMPLGKALDGLAALGTVASLAEATSLLRDVILQLRDVVVITWGPGDAERPRVSNAWALPPKNGERDFSSRKTR